MSVFARKIADVEGQIAALRSKLALLRELAAEMGETPAAPTAVSEVPPPGKPVARPPREPTGDPAPDPGERERTLLRLLSEHPDGLRVNELLERTGWPMPTVRHALRNSPLFEKADPSYLRSPWVLTEAGERAAGGGGTSAGADAATPAPAT